MKTSNGKSGMKVGIQTRLWGPAMNRGDQPELIRQVAAAGFSGIEIGVQHLNLTKPEAFRHLLEANGLSLASLHIAGQYDQPELAKAALDDAERAVAFASRAGAFFVTVSGREQVHKSLEEIQSFSERLNQIGELCNQAGLQLCHHNHYWEILEDCRELKALSELTDPGLVSLCLDIGWAQRVSGDAVEIAQAFLDRIGYFHLRDIARDTACEATGEASGDRWVPLGQGQVDYPALFKLILAHPFPWQVVEQEPPEADISATPFSIACALREVLRADYGI